MVDPVHVLELLIRWQELRQQGQHVSAEELCSGKPELLKAVRQGIERLQDQERLLKTVTSMPEGRNEADPSSSSVVGTATEMAGCREQGETHDLTERPTGPNPSSSEIPFQVPGYQILEAIGSGGMGIVYRAREERLKREVAIKTILPEYLHNEGVCKRFLEEANIMAQLQHPGIVPIYELGSLPESNQPFFAMKLVKGEKLSNLLDDRATPAENLGRFLQILGYVCDAVGYAHEHGVLHRDLKPDNVMVDRRFNVVHVMDWGIGKVLATDRSMEWSAAEVGTRVDSLRNQAYRTQDALGTFAYMSPEQANKDTAQLVDERSDVFSLGAILCEILIGTPPYAADLSAEVRLKAKTGQLEESVARLRSCCAPAPLVQLAEQCLMKDRLLRPANAKVVAKAIQDYQQAVEEQNRRSQLQLHETKVRAEEEAARRVVAEEKANAQEQAKVEAEARARAERQRRRAAIALAASVLTLGLVAGIGVWWYQQKRSSEKTRLVEAAQRLDLALAEVDERRNLGRQTGELARFQEAAASLDKARELARTAGIDTRNEEIKQATEQLESEQAAVTRTRVLLIACQEVRQPPDIDVYERADSGRVRRLPEPDVDEQFAKVFQTYGLDVDQTPPLEVLSRLGALPEPLVQELVAAFDEWWRERREAGRPEKEWMYLHDIAERLDRNQLRKELRRLMRSDQLRKERIAGEVAAALLPCSRLSDIIFGENRNRLRDMATRILAPGAPDEPALSIYALAIAHWSNGDLTGAERLLRKALARRPGELLLLTALGDLLEHMRPPRRQEAVECYKAARALRAELGVKLSKCLVDVKRAKEAEEILREMINRIPDHSELRFGLGCVLDAQGRFEEGYEAYRKAVELRPDFADAFNNMGCNLVIQKRYAEAEAVFHKAIQINPNFAWAHNNLGDCLIETKRYAEAEPVARRAIQLNSTLTRSHANLRISLLGQKKYDEAEAACRRLVEKEPRLAWAHNNLGVCLYECKKYQEAEGAYHKAIELKPNYAQAYSNLGVSLKAQKKYAAAEAAYRRAMELDPEDADPHNNLGSSLNAQRKFIEAEASIRKAVELNPKLAMALFNLGACLYGQNRLTGAESAYRRAIALDPDLVPAHFGLASCLAMQSRHAEAEIPLRRVLEIEPDNAQAINNLGNSLYMQGKRAEAEPYFRKAIQMKPDSVQAHYNLGNCLKDQKKFADAEVSFRKAIELQPGNPRTHLGLGNCFYEQKLYAKAEPIFRKCIELDPKYAMGHFNLGLTLLKLRRLNEALAEQQKANELLPNQASFLVSLKKTQLWVEFQRKEARLLARAERLESGEECVQFAGYCVAMLDRPVSCVFFYQEAFRRMPVLLNDSDRRHRYNAASSAALALAGNGSDAKELHPEERYWLSHLALDWLRGDLDAYASLFAGTNTQDKQAAYSQLVYWKESADLAGVRDAKSLAAFPEDERKRWLQLWADVDALLAAAAANK